MDCKGHKKGDVCCRMKMRRRTTTTATRQRRRRGAAVAGDGSVRMKVKKLQKLIPGGRGLKPDRLFSKTADYILRLRLQVDVLKSLSKIYDE